METEQLTEISIAYYQDGETQEDIAKKFGISRAKVGRLLRKARDEGIVEITVKYHPVFSAKLEQQLTERFGLKRALIALDQTDENEQRRLVAMQVSNYLNTNLRDEMVVAVGQGRNIAAVADHVGVEMQRNCRFVCAIGGTHRSGDAMNADHICRQLAKRYNGRNETLYAPAYVENEEINRLLCQNSTVKDTLDLARKSEFALVGVGDMNENSNMVKLGWFSPKEIVEARLQQGIIGDIMGYDFFDIHGNNSETVMSGRVIGLNLNDLKRIPNVIAVASESSKALAVLGALRTGAIDVLATSVSNALTILNLAEQDGPLKR
ncbi:sugar-binding transcriptional regulator [Alginatibacterium sediminis]|uniref:Sugar-binding transcriptional regulator n=1 Tax=Alginatibacterium sediminis TaxID=2164068 RepID=A0A420EHZ6_9ALTE|nr:sugar-binding transcriptional regulator [Alginatibacterium sediminis]RKF20280.1 sugar-binding transcriptional regulator [Alginatibacterium sediminis]